MVGKPGARHHPELPPAEQPRVRSLHKLVAAFRAVYSPATGALTSADYVRLPEELMDEAATRLVAFILDKYVGGGGPGGVPHGGGGAGGAGGPAWGGAAFSPAVFPGAYPARNAFAQPATRLCGSWWRGRTQKTRWATTSSQRRWPRTAGRGGRGCCRKSFSCPPPFVCPCAVGSGCGPRVGAGGWRIKPPTRCYGRGHCGCRSRTRRRGGGGRAARQWACDPPRQLTAARPAGPPPDPAHGRPHPLPPDTAAPPLHPSRH